MERTFVMVKPDRIQRLIGEIIRHGWNSADSSSSE